MSVITLTATTGTLAPESSFLIPESVAARFALRGATAEDAPAIHALLVEHLTEGHLLPRELAEIALHAHRFVVATEGDSVVACAELAPLSRSVSEIRSLVVSRDARGCGVGTEMIEEL